MLYIPVKYGIIFQHETHHHQLHTSLTHIFTAHVWSHISIIKVKLSLCLTKHYAIKTYWGSRGIAPHILNLGTRWRWMVSFLPQVLQPWEKNTW